MRNIGFLYNCSMNTNPTVRLSPSVINRASLIDARLRDADRRIFFYSPKHIRDTEAQVPGYLLEGGKFVPSEAAVPKVNGNWTYATRTLLDKGMGYQRFMQWAERRRIGIFVPGAFSELLRDKFETYRLVRAYHESLHPHCEPYRRTTRQLDAFLSAARTTFIKPRAGSKGNRILTVTREGSGLTITRYANRESRHCRAASSREARDVVDELTGGAKRYVIQQGVDPLRYRDNAFDVRVVMVHDGCSWTWVHEGRCSRTGSDLSNVSQGGESVITEDLLFDVLGYEGAQQMIHRLEGESFGLAAYLERLHPGDIMEVAFDFVIDGDERLRLLEINTKPGLAGIGYQRRVHEMRPADEPLFERWVYPHTTGLARFLLAKAHELD